MAAFEVRDRLLAAFDAVEKVTDVAAELIELVAALVGDGGRPELGVARIPHSCDASHGLAVRRELWHRVLRANHAVRGDREAIARNRQGTFRSAENKTRSCRFALSRLAVRPGRRKARKVEDRVL